MTGASAQLKAASAFKDGFGGVLRIEPSDGPSFIIDGRSEICEVGPAAPDTIADCGWRAATETLIRIFEGGRALEGAYLSGRLHISGDMSVMARLVLETSR